jgi:hypothetical protein
MATKRSTTEQAQAAIKAAQETAAEWVELERLHGWEHNPKRHPDAQVADLMRSIKRFGWGAVILARPNGEIIAGHGRLEAAKRLGLAKVPVRWLNLDPTEAHLLALADNKLTEIGEWDDALVGRILAEAQAEGADLTGLGWDESELQQLMIGDKQEASQSENQYTKKIEAPIYTPKGPCPSLTEMVDTTKTDALTKRIEKSSLPGDVKGFLMQAATRHTVFDFEKIAEFYAHADEETQGLMEESALVIIDFEKAIEHGFVKLSDRLNALLALEE